MKSPYTGKEMTLVKESREIIFRKETFEITHHAWLCEDSKEQFTTTELDEVNLTQAYNQFRVKHKLPFPEEIIDIRDQYGLSAAKMSEILGFGINVYRQYEQGEVPNESNARLIQLAHEPERFRSLVELCGSLEQKVTEKILHRIDLLMQTQHKTSQVDSFENYLLGQLRPDEFSGYKRPSLEKFAAMVVEFSKKLHPWKTMLNKLVFYADFLHFSRTCQSISGMRYVAYALGPVPNKFQLIYQYLADRKAFEIEYIEYENGSVGERFGPPSAPIGEEILTPAEHATIAEVIQRFQLWSTKEIVAVSHRERAWLEAIESPQKSISYLKYGFDVAGRF
jgi:putative zinc finger/helix-turn-helix YgiT family protein